MKPDAHAPPDYNSIATVPLQMLIVGAFFRGVFCIKYRLHSQRHAAVLQRNLSFPVRPREKAGNHKSYGPRIRMHEHGISDDNVNDAK